MKIIGDPYEKDTAYSPVSDLSKEKKDPHFTPTLSTCTLGGVLSNMT